MAPNDQVQMSKKEKAAVAALRRLAKRWPSTLWLFAGTGGGLHVMRTDIPNDGGDW